jgi:putative transcriptional regulator
MGKIGGRRRPSGLQLRIARTSLKGMAISSEPSSPRFFAGHMLLAMPGIGDPRFEHAAIALCSHSEHGALGIDVSSVIEGLSLRDLLANFEIQSEGLEHAPVLRGGPVDPHRGFVLHSLDWGGQDLLQVNAQWGMSGSLDILRAISEGKGPERYMVALGYAGWSAGQIEHEMTGHGWFLGGEIPANLARTPPARRWTQGFAACGVDARMLAVGSGSA